MRSLPVLAAAFSLVLASAAARADAPAASAHDPHQAFRETDTNHDGLVDHAEFAVRITDIFFLHDTDKDGGMSAEELARLEVPTDNTKKADRDHDGSVSFREFEAARFQDFDEADTDQDGQLSLDEVLKALHPTAAKPH